MGKRGKFFKKELRISPLYWREIYFIIEEVKALKKSDYTAESYAAVEKALKDAERILALDAPTLKQTEIAAENLENATKELVSVSTEQKGSDSESSGCNGALGIPLFGVGAAVGFVLKKRRK